MLNSIEINAIHVEELPKGDESTDKEISDYADLKNLFVLTKDQDFYHSHMINHQPKKLFLISVGNIKNRKLFDIFRSNRSSIKVALHRSSFIELHNKGLIEHK